MKQFTMRHKTRVAINFSLVVLPVLSVIFLMFSVESLVISLNPDIKWNEYDEYDDRYDIYAYYYNSLWSSLDGYWYAQLAGKYYQTLTLVKGSLVNHDESWKIPVRTELYKSIGLNSVSLFLLIFALAVQAATKKKLLTVVLTLSGLIVGIAAGCVTFKALQMFKDGIVIGISVVIIQSEFYFPEKEQMKLGYNLAFFSALFTLFSCVFILLSTGLYIAFGDGKWIGKECGKQTNDVHDIQET